MNRELIKLCARCFFQEDMSRMRFDNSPENYADLRNLAIKIIKKDKIKKASIKGIMLIGSLNNKPLV